MGFQLDAPNGRLSNENHDRRIIAPNRADLWGELDTLERIF